MTKIVVNRCYGGFSLSPRAVKEIAKRKGKKCYFFLTDIKSGMYSKKPVTLTKLEKYLRTNRISFWSAYSVQKPNFSRMSRPDKDGLYRSANKYADSISLDSRLYGKERADEDLVTVVKKMGKKANGSFAKLEIVEVPDDSDWYIDEYDGQETVREGRTW